MMKNLIKTVLIMSMFVIPASCEVIKPLIIEDAANVGIVDVTLLYNASVVNVTNVTGKDFDVSIANLEHVREGWVRIGVFQTDNPGLNGRITFASITLDGDSDDFGSLSMTVNTLKDATPQSNPISYTIEGRTIRVSSSTSPADSGDVGGGAGYLPAPTSTPAASQMISSEPRITPVEEETSIRAITPAPENVTTFYTGASSVLSPIAGIVMIVVVFGIVVTLRRSRKR
jgi:hypothetical protein